MSEIELRARRGLPADGLVADLAGTDLRRRPLPWLPEHRHA
jgi:hypothetical protein